LAEGPNLRAAPNIASFLADPIGAYVLRRAFCFWQIEGANGVLAWGAPDLEDVAEMCSVFDVALVCPRVGRHVSLVDATAISGVEARAFKALSEHLSLRRDAWALHVERQAVLVDRGVFGAALAGLFALLRPRYPTRSFSERERAFAWLAARDSEKTRRTYLKMRSLALEVPEVVRQLRGLLDAEQSTLTLSDAARRIGVTPRTLQRRLLEAKTSMREEGRAFRLRLSAHLLATSDLTVARIARAAGVTEAQLGKMYRAAYRMSPSAFRARRSRKPPGG